jgi:hypothetical protein
MVNNEAFGFSLAPFLKREHYRGQHFSGSRRAP